MITEIERVANLSDSDFRANYLPANLPLVISGCIEHWPARKNWNLDYFIRNFGSKSLRFSGREWTIREFAEALKRGEKPAPYLKEVKLDEQFPEIGPDIGDLRFTRNNLLNSSFLPNSMRIHKGIRALFIGGAGSSFGTLHWDYSYLQVYISQIVGVKDFIIYSPEDTPCLYPNPKYPNKSLIADFNDFDVEAYPDVKRAKPIKLTIGEGDTLFIPAGWWHATQMRDLSISVAESALDTSNWHQRGDWYLENFRSSGVPLWRRIALKAYMRTVVPFLPS